MAEPVRNRSPFLVAALAWLAPGAGYLLIGQRARGLVIGITILVLIILGTLIGGVRVYDVPGYDRYGHVLKLGYHTYDQGRKRIRLRDTDEHPSGDYSRDERKSQQLTTAIFSDFSAELFDKPWYALQILSGAPAIVLSKISINLSHPGEDGSGIEDVRRSHAAVWEMGVLYTAIAGMLNLLAMIDSAYRSSRRRSEPTPHAVESPPVSPPPASRQRGAAA